ncbi:hypothetical protein [Limnoglobus roseus]|uniref:Uncharacterized protein n=1 Tax=Limnoglobus roseus TaxID=2598579 RepID=A0A5C1AF60_9BACT|nr:hypothetical protein [Limnoglobus roseus]QEL16606.1 hypothetical protein PX52LOC_03566 [Limnoglobus roseus]
MTPDTLAEATLRRTAADPALVGSRLERHRLTNGWAWPELAANLGTDVHHLAKLSLCAMPREESFAADVNAIAKVGQVSPAALAALLRQVEALRNWDDIQPSGTGFVMAAHRTEPPATDPTDDPAGT